MHTNAQQCKALQNEAWPRATLAIFFEKQRNTLLGSRRLHFPLIQMSELSMQLYKPWFFKVLDGCATPDQLSRQQIAITDDDDDGGALFIQFQ